MNLKKRFPRYAKFLYLYPVAYRRQYGDQMLQTLADMLDDAPGRKVRVWARTAMDLPFSIIKQQILYTGDVMTTQMPDYIKRNALLGAWLVAPFFAFIIANAIVGKRLYDTIFWHRNVLFAWLVVLPGLAVLFNLAALLRWMNARHKETHTGSWRLLTELRRYWPAAAIVLVGIGIIGLTFFHDSVHCVLGNPLHEAKNWHQTLRCVQQR